MAHDPLDLGPTRRHFIPGSEVFGRYELIERIGVGKLGEVWKAKDKRLDMTVAIKLLENFASFSAVAGTVGRSFGLAHPNIVRTYGFEGDADLCGFIMEHVKGVTLADALRTRQPPFFEAGEVRPWAVQLFTALKFAWEQGKLVHGDLRPANLFITSGGTLKVAEFGLAAARQGEVITEASYATSTFSLPCLSPQRLNGEVPVHSDDVYAAGACLYEALTGRSLFPGGNVMVQIQRKVPPTVAERRAELAHKGEAVPRPWETLLASCLQKEREARPASAAEALATLETMADTATRGTAASRTTKVLAAPRAAVGPALSLIRHPLVIVGGVLAACAVLLFVLILKPRAEALSAMRAEVKKLELADAAPGAVAAERAAAWEAFIGTWSLKPVSFTDEDEAMITHADEQSRHWAGEVSRLAAAGEVQKRKIADDTSRLRVAVAQQQQADASPSLAIADRIAAWDLLMKQYSAPGHPETKDYGELLARVGAAQKQWADKEAAVKKQAADEAARMLDETRLAEQKAVRWREDRESAWAALGALVADPAVGAAAKAEKLTAFLPTLNDPPKGAEKRAVELLALATEASQRSLAAAGEESPKEPLKLDQLLADSPVKDQPAPVQHAFLFLAQEKLKEKGFYKDKPDGNHGAGSNTALIEFQKDTKRLVANGMLDLPTVKELGLDQPDLAALAEEGKKLAKAESAEPKHRSKKPPPEKPGVLKKGLDSVLGFGKKLIKG